LKKEFKEPVLKYSLIIVFLIALQLPAFSFIDVTAAGNAGIPFSNHLDQNLLINNIIVPATSDPYRVSEPGIKAGANLELGFRLPGDKIGLSVDFYLNGFFTITLFSMTGQTDLISLYSRAGITLESYLNFKAALPGSSLRDSAFFAGAGYQMDMILFHQYLYGPENSLVFSPGFINLSIFQAGFEKMFRKGSIKSKSYHQNAFKVKPRIYFGLGMNNRQTQFKFNRTTGLFELNPVPYTLDGSFSLKAGIDVAFGFQINLAPMIKGEPLHLSDNSLLTSQDEDFSFKKVLDKASSVHLKAVNLDIYSVYNPEDPAPDGPKLGEYAADLIRNDLSRLHPFQFSTEPESARYEMIFYLSGLKARKTRMMNTATHEIQIRVHVFEKNTLNTGSRCSGIVQVSREIKLPAGYRGTLSEYFMHNRENLENLLDEFVRIFDRDFIRPDLTEKTEFKPAILTR
jgi:hypothetical protein